MAYMTIINFVKDQGNSGVGAGPVLWAPDGTFDGRTISP